MPVDDLLARDFGTLAALVRAHAADRPAQAALVQGKRRVSYGELDRLMDRVAAALQRDGLRRRAIAICAATSIEYSAPSWRAARVAGPPLAPSAAPQASPPWSPTPAPACSSSMPHARVSLDPDVNRGAAHRSKARRRRPLAAWLAPRMPHGAGGLEPSLRSLIIVLHDRAPKASCSRISCAGSTWRAPRASAIAPTHDPRVDAAHSTPPCVLPADVAQAATVVLMGSRRAGFRARRKDPREPAMLVPVRTAAIALTYSTLRPRELPQKVRYIAPFAAALRPTSQRGRGHLIGFWALRGGAPLSCALCPRKLHRWGPVRWARILLNTPTARGRAGEAVEVVGRPDHDNATTITALPLRLSGRCGGTPSSAPGARRFDATVPRSARPQEGLIIPAASTSIRAI